MKFVVPAVLVLVIAAGVGIGAAKVTGSGPFNSSMSVSLLPPTSLVQSQPSNPNSSLAAGSWLNHGAVMLSGARAGAVTDERLQVEVVPMRAHFSDRPTATGSAGSDDPSVMLRHLGSGTYKWQARFYSGSDVSPWVTFRPNPAFSVDLDPPSAPIISSSTNPVPGRVYRSTHLLFSWTSHDAGSGISGYWYRFDTQKSITASPYLRTSTAGASLWGIPTGTYYLHVRARDRVGNWGPARTFPVRIDATPPAIAHVFFSRFQFFPRFDDLRISFTVTHTSKVRVGVYTPGGSEVRLVALGTVRPGQRTTFTWRGRDDHSRLVPGGQYNVFIRTTDQYGNTNLQGYRDFTVRYERIRISLSQQRLWAYDGNRLFLTSLVTTGNPALPTPTGTFRIGQKFHPYKFISSWPKSSPYYYPPSVVQYALWFHSGGYFIHDAPWRSNFGPGSNASLGTPGQNYTGTHGCVNTPPDVAYKLYKWAPTGTPVQIVK